MKKTLATILLLCFAISANANITETKEYKVGLKAFNSRDYKKSLEVFNTLFEKDSANPQVNFYLGRNYFMLRKFEKAVVAFDRVLIMDEEHTRTKLELARTYLALRMLKDAKKLFKEVLLSDAPKSVKDKVKSLLKSIDKADSRVKNNFLLAINVGFDDNINSNGGQILTDYMVNSLGLNESGVSGDDKIVSRFVSEMFNARSSYDFGRKGGWVLDSSAVILNQNYNYKDYDLLFKNISTGPSYSTKKYKVSFPITYDHVNYAHDQLLHSVYVQPKLTMPLSKTLLMNAYAKYQEKMYFDTHNKGKNAKVREASVTLLKLHKPHKLSLGYTVSREDRVNMTTDKYIDKLSHIVKLNYMRSFSIFDLDAGVTYKKINYYDEYATGLTRDDRSYVYLLGLSRKINKMTLLKVSYQNSKNISNYKPVMYNKNTYTVSLNYMF
jgi:tetratricopeptide (TPR) repeat protein